MDIPSRTPDALSDQQCENLRKQSKAAVNALIDANQNGIDLKVKSGEVLSLIGPSGSGKTTLIRTINDLEKINSEEIVLFK